MRRIRLLSMVLSVFLAMSACLYGATFANNTINTKIDFGLAAIILYAILMAIPYLKAKRYRL